MTAMDTKRFLSLIDLHSRGLEDALSLHNAGNDDAAANAVIEVLKKRLSAIPDGISPADEKTMEGADALLENRLSLLQTRLHNIGNPIDWVLCPDVDQHWQSHLGYLYFPKMLLSAHAATGKLCYIDKWKDIHRQFLKNHPLGTADLTYSKHLPVYENEYLPVYGGEGFCPDYIGGSWISLACESRTASWTEELAYLTKQGLMENDLLGEMILSLMTDHLHVLMNAPRRGTPNQFLSCAGALVQLSVLFWEFFAAAGAYFVGMSRLETAFRLCVLPDGTDLEQSPNYNSGLPRRFRKIEENCKLGENRRMAALRSKAVQRCEYLALITDPTGAIPDIAKSHAADGALPLLEEFCAMYPEAEVLQRVTKLLRDGTVPDLPLYRDFDYGGISMLRSSWDKDASWLLTKYSRYSPGHKHEDANSLMLTARGRRMLVDSGNFNYADDPESRILNGYFYNSAAHNTLTADSLSQRRLSMEKGFKVDERIPESTTNEAEYEKVRSIETLAEVPCPGFRHHTEDFDVLQSFYTDGYQQLTEEGCYSGDVLCAAHRRTVVYIRKADVFAVLDAFIPEDDASHTVTLHWNFGPDYKPEDFVFTDEGIFTAAEGGNLSLWCLSADALRWEHGYGEKDPYRGWYTVDYGIMVPAMDAAVTQEGKGKRTFLTLLRPRTGKETAVLSKTENGVSLQLAEGSLSVVKTEAGCSIAFGGKTLYLTPDGAE